MQLTAGLALRSMNEQVQKTSFSSHGRETKPAFSMIFKNDIEGLAIQAADVRIDYFSTKYKIPSFERSGIVFDAFNLKCMI